MSLIGVPFLATDTLMRLQNPKDIGPSIKFLTYSLENYRGLAQQNLLSSVFCLVLSNSATLVQKAKVVMQKMQQNIQLKPCDLLLSMSDNVLWMRKFGEDSGTYDHKFAKAFIMKSEAELIKDGIYEAGLSCQQKSWEKDIVQSSTTEEILTKYCKVTPERANIFCSLIHTHIYAMLKARAYNVPMDETKRKCDKKEFRWDQEKRLPLLHRILTDKDILLLNDPEGAAPNIESNK